MKLKRHGNLFNKITDIDNLRMAHKNARKGKTTYREVIDVDSNEEYYLNALKNMLESKSYKVSPYKMFKKIDKGKEREIYKLPYFPDRIIHHAILQVLEPIWKKLLIKNTYQSIKGRGVTSCKRDVQKCLRKYRSDDVWVTKFDIKKFYPSVNNEILKTIISRKIKCKSTLELLYTIIDSHEGLPIGNYISQYLGNLYLTGLDYFMKSNSDVLGYFRYCDDIVVVSACKDSASRVYLDTKHYVNTKLHLEIKHTSQYFSITNRKLDFVGFVYLYNGKTKLRKSIIKNMVKSLKKNNEKSIASYYGWCLESRSFSLWTKYYKGDKVWKLRK